MNDEKNITDIQPILITVDEACKLLNMGANTVRKLVKTKGFPALIFPHKILIDKNQLSTWVAKNYGTYRN